MGMCVRVVGGEGGGGGGAVELESACYRFLSFDVLRQVELNNPLETFRFKDVDDYADDV